MTSDPREPAWTRRHVLSRGAAAFAAGAAAEDLDDDAAATPDAGSLRIEIPTYESLGVRPVLNGFGVHNGDTLLPLEVRRAMERASERYVIAAELVEAAGQRIAELTGAPFAVVTSGATAAACAATCACVAGTDAALMERLPDTTGARDEVLVPTTHRHPYDRGIRMTGARLAEVVDPAELARRAGERTAMVALLGVALDGAGPTLEEWIEPARERDLPVFVDAAGEPPTRPDRYVAAGVDLVAYSAAKCLRGPESAGYLLGREALVRAAAAHLLPNVQFGRPMKVGKEEIMGTLAALELWFGGRDHAAEAAAFRRRLEHVRRVVLELAGVEARIEAPRRRANVAPRLAVRWDRERVPLDAEEVRAALLAGEPRVLVPTAKGGILVLSQALEAGDEVPVARRIRDVLSSGR